ncbi:MAG: NADH-quinone oxidoreductase subunit F [Tenericutes bacterium GWC2_39_45]|nr:MAG: NADH-quinone oxidoreductase subunit F [Tenericutes bacterium GWA2_38_26]OHE31329.1 MAG: NADH-quinone oxidoreductase subunit F [Tenericutes bacterium GWC2_39_45]OHE31627.1 MAG: NADH-quinone oxidoreductase subunit F [Tenericutes bacterium GWD2_38_27]OHE35219.1 MAG: NADH-quinone oxidoreductase subunit F [Tenericutes bacterium GWE2_38_8]OHE45018.1 MAG: NADH-quinone oxidoreductase subunit F [Tenericutes bacterium GWF2_38_8]
MIEMKLISKRFGKINPLSIDEYIKFDGYKNLKKALSMEKTEIIEEVQKAYLRGRGGAGFPAAIKMMGLAKEANKDKYIICNADEGEPGNFKDRYLMENDPHQIIEGMIIVAYATGGTKGFIYVRGEYQKSMSLLKWSIDEAKKKGFLGQKIMGSKFNFDIEVRSGAGSYVCGEEFALIESIEGNPGRTRVKPPFPTQVGLYGKPTLINNVETFSTIPTIIEMGGVNFAKIGTPSSTGTKLISLSGNVKNKGVFEIPFGVPIKDVIYKLGGGIEKDRKIKMVQLGGACGPIIPEYMLDMIIDFERFEEFESKTGAGAIIVIDERFDIFTILLKVVRFFQHESCGKCTPCREGHIQLGNLIEKFIERKATMQDIASLESLARVIHQASLCGLGQTSPTAIISSLKYFRDDYIDRVEHPERG